MKIINSCLIFIWVLSSCKKPSENYKLTGKMSDASSGAALPYVSASFEQKALVNGIYNGYFIQAASATSDLNGKYELEWKRENITEARLLIAREFYYSQEIPIAPDDLRVSGELNKDIALWPEASVQVAIANASAASIIQFNWVGTNYSCSCCTNETKTFVNLSDTVFQCNVYGGRWLKYNCSASGSSGTSFLLDSVFCSPFQQNFISLSL